MTIRTLECGPEDREDLSVEKSIQKYQVGYTQADIDGKLALLEARVRRLESVVNAMPTQPPIDRGMTYYPEGDPVPSHGGPAEYLDGKIWVINGIPVAFIKNTAGRPLRPGEKWRDGTVDSKLRYQHVSPNNYFYLEV